MVGAGTDSANKPTNARDDLAFITQERYEELLENSRKKTYPMMCLEDKDGFVINGTKKV